MAFDFFGVDYGAKIAGTTAVTYLSNNQLNICQSAKGHDADEWLKNLIDENSPSALYIDAPLSLPGAYFGYGNDFIFRKADKEVSAMSPMFLGGLTARAIAIKYYLKQHEINCIEVYPGACIRSKDVLKSIYIKKDLRSIGLVMDVLENMLPYPISVPPTNFHQLDSIICWYIGWKHTINIANSSGDMDEGIILY